MFLKLVYMTTVMLGLFYIFYKMCIQKMPIVSRIYTWDILIVSCFITLICSWKGSRVVEHENTLKLFSVSIRANDWWENLQGINKYCECVYMIGLIIFFTVWLLFQSILVLKQKEKKNFKENELKLCYEKVWQRVGLKKAPELYCFGRQNMVFKGIKSSIILEEGFGELDEDEQEYVLLHELYHIKNRDAWRMDIAKIILGFLWFHPLAWIHYSLYCCDLEMLCDSRVLKEKKGKKQYAKLLVSYVDIEKKYWIVQKQILFLGNSLERRIKEMSKSEKRNKKIYIGYMVLVVLLMCIGGIFVKNTIIHGNEGIITKNQITEVEEHDIELAPPKGRETFQHTTILEKDNRRAEAQKGVESNNRLSDEYEYLTR